MIKKTTKPKPKPAPKQKKFHATAILCGPAKGKKKKSVLALLGTMRGVFLVNHGGAIKFFVTYEGGEDGQAALNLYNFTGRVICISHRK